MKIGIVTYWSSDDNYGQQLQCWALQRYLLKKGYSPFLIRYSPKNKIPFIDRVVRKILVYLRNERVFLKYEKSLKKINGVRNKERNFPEFRQENLIVSEQEYKDIFQLRKSPPQADVYICGSDQVWHNPLSVEDTKGWFLDFGNMHTKRISYAASIGREYSDKEKTIFKNVLSKFSAVSVREDSSKKLCDSLGIDSTVTLDPTLLLSSADYDLLQTESSIYNGKEYVFLYALNALTPDDISWTEIKGFIDSEYLDLHPVFSSGYVQARELCPGYKSNLDTIPQWLFRLKSAKYVITNSFHGMVFAILFHRPFMVIPLKGKYSSGNNRIISLLTNIGLLERIYNDGLPFLDQLKRRIKWDEVDHRLFMLQEDSISFLYNSIKL